ncbi:MAG: ATP-dependent DNA helicase RecG [Butyrivibrio sp.]|nr:ATP-dependent DNA helicase RecG [Butyrivibrio sp.]
MRIRGLKGIGSKTEQLFNRLGVYDAEDLLSLYPRRYDVYEPPADICEMTENKPYAFWGTVISDCEVNTRSRYKVVSVYAADDKGGRIKLTWFNMPFLAGRLKRGFKFIFRGEAAFKGSLVFMEQPALYSYEQYMSKMNSMQPVYPLTAGLTNNAVTKAVKQCFQTGLILKEYLPSAVLSEAGLTGREEAAYAIHFPTDKDSLAQARRRIVFDEFFLFTLALRSLKNANLLANNDKIIPQSAYSATILANLGYELTNAQKKVRAEITSDMAGKRTMNRLIQGDVGSGKTIVAFLAMTDAAAAGLQSALMAPTEVLARQHYEDFCRTLKKNGIPLRCVLLTGSMPAAAKREALEAAADGRADIVIGTHAVISDGVCFKRLGLVVTDEQHRFGVRQREALRLKGVSPHILVMSATPIPRSLAIILYGDLDISIIDEKPSNRLPIKNCVVDDSYRQRAYKFIENELLKGHQAYVICAMAEDNDDSDNALELENAVNYANELRRHYGGRFTVEHLHGKMKSAAKNEIMERFADGEIQILVSTTVVEVGINVPNATVMLVENAERFGLAGLHQLRGRVGRGDSQSYCIFVSNTKNELTKERLAILKDSNDGFYIAEQDLRLRGPGDMLGARQSGDFGFALGNIYADSEVLKLAADEARRLLEADGELCAPENSALKRELERYMKNALGNLNI